MRRSLLLVSVASLSLAAPAMAQEFGTTGVPSTAEEQASSPQVGEGAVTDTTTANTAAAAEVTGTGDIVVTATRRAERLADVPLAISAVTNETLNNSGANDIRQLNQLAPSLLVSSTGSEANASARIRGVGTVGDNPGLESSVAVFIDGVYRSRTGVGLSDLGEIDRVEVLRGPQGTLFGRNASAGLLNIITRAPSFTLGATGEATYGNYDAFRFSGSVTGPVSDKLALRLDGVYARRDGFFEDTVSDRRFNNRERYFLRGQALFEPTSDLSLRLIGDFTERNENCCAAVYATQDVSTANVGLISPSNPIVPVLLGVSGATFAEYFPSANNPFDRRVAITPGRNYDGQTKDYGGSGEINWNLGPVSLTSITAYREYRNAQGADADYGLADILFFGPDSFREFHTFSQELRFNGSLFDDRVDWLVGGYYANEDLRTQSQLNFGADYGRFAACRIIGGLNPATLGPISPNSPGCLNPAVASALSAPTGPFGPAGALIVGGFNRLSTIANVGDDTSNFNQNSENFAFFTHNIVHLTDRLDLTLGLRYTNEKKTLSANFNNTNTACPAQQDALRPLLGNAALAPLAGGLITLACQGNSTSALNGITLDDERREDKFTGTAVLSWKATDDLLVYGSFSRGYKAGGFNLDRSAFNNPPGTIALPIGPLTQANAAFYSQNLQFDEEEVDAYEIGLKYSTRQFTFNVAAFRQEFSSFQLNTFNGTFYLVQNINGCSSDLSATGTCGEDDVKAGLVSQGVEIEASLVPARNFRVGAGLTYAKTEFADRLVGSKDGSLALDPALRLLPGQNLSNAPELVVTNSVTWTPDIGNTGLTGLFYVDSRLASDYNTGSDLYPQKEQDSVLTVNGRIGVRGPDEKWGVELWAQNLFNENYSQVVFSSPFQATTANAATNAAYPPSLYPGGTQIFSAYLAEPRTYGITLRGRF